MAKDITFSDEARNKMFIGVQKIADAVRVTMGPKGRNVVIEKGYGSPLITNDGVTIAREVHLKNKLENVGASLIKEAATKTNDSAGDGTTSSTVLAYAIIKEGMKVIAAGANPMVLKNGIETAVEKVVEELEKNAKKITTHEELVQVASISAQSNEVGELIADVMREVTTDGVITVQEGKTFALEKKIVKGMQFDHGYVSPYMITNKSTNESVYEESLLLVTDKTISSLPEILPLLEKLAKSGEKQLVIIAEEIEGEALNTLILNRIRGGFNTLAIKAPGFGDHKKELLEDICILTGATFISDESGIDLKSVEKEHLGGAQKIVSTKEKTMVIDGYGDKELLQERIDQIQEHIKEAKNGYDKEKLKERYAKLAGGVGIIGVGATTEVEMQDKKLRIEDALAATRAAVEEGIVAGGGTALLKCIKVLDALKMDEHDAQVGVDIVRNALMYPARQIAENAGKDGGVIISDVMRKKDINVGYNASTDEITDLVAGGIIDPKKVTRCSLQYAASVAAMFLTTEASITEEEIEVTK